MTTAAGQRVELSLISHTNAGKTTLARTLLRRDIGQVADRPHVTEQAECDVLIESSSADTLVLWDTPGFGDSVRLLKRLQQGDHALGWFLTQVWDRLADRPFWCGQQAMRNAREVSDVILYVVNASESPSSAAYVDAEMHILSWFKKPVILLLNQIGPPRDDAHSQTEVKEWQAYGARYPYVRSVLPFDAFARCWVQEGTLLTEVQRLLSDGKRAAFERLQDAWKRRNLAVFDQSMQAVARHIAAMVADSEPIVDLNLQGKARAWLGAAANAIKGTADRGNAELERAQQALDSRLYVQIRATTEELVRLHGLTGSATEEVLQRMGSDYQVQRPADADKAGVLGGIVSGALGGLAADLGAGGLTFGAGAVIGSVLGAFGARGLAKAYNLARGSDAGSVRWSAEFLESRIAAALMRYLAVAHFGRGRGEFVTGAAPAHWIRAVREALATRQDELKSACDVNATAASVLPLVSASMAEVLARLYP